MTLLTQMLALVVLTDGTQATPLLDFDSLRWDYRIILIETHEHDDILVAELERHAGAIVERDILWFIVDGDQIQSNYSGELLPEFHAQLIGLLESEDDPVLLIGKDGGIKMTQPRLDLDSVFQRVDSMPMRQSEMRR